MEIKDPQRPLSQGQAIFHIRLSDLSKTRGKVGRVIDQGSTCPLPAD